MFYICVHLDYDDQVYNQKLNWFSNQLNNLALAMTSAINKKCYQK